MVVERIFDGSVKQRKLVCISSIEFVKCSCKLFKSFGIPCRHMLTLLSKHVGSQTTVNNETLSTSQSNCPVIDPILAKGKGSGKRFLRGKEKAVASLNGIVKSVDHVGTIKENVLQGLECMEVFSEKEAQREKKRDLWFT
ncbi:hypothetical protein Q3G72_004148 [Acer saccharum]|nr:hypothetical protein Q3G72_004148 [Acer saccharum]